MSTDKKKHPVISGYAVALLMALPAAAAVIYAALRWGPTVKALLNVVIKMVVTA